MHFRSNKIDEATDLVKQFHYSRRAPGNVQFVGSLHEDGGLFGDCGPILAACFFSIPPTRWSESVWELSRLVRRDDATPSLSQLIGACCRFLKATKQIDLLVSFADKTQGHHGGIYQACSWSYDGAREKRMDGVLIAGVFVPGRSCNSKYGTRSPVLLSARMPQHTIEPHYDEGKHLYWRALNRDGKRKAERLGLKATPYPKPHAA